MPQQKKEIEQVDCIASGYEWVCPKCGKLNRIIEWAASQVCQNRRCKKAVELSEPEHAMG